VLSDSDLYELWECLAGERDAREIHQKGYEEIKGVCLRVAYNLKNEIQLTELSTKVRSLELRPQVFGSHHLVLFSLNLPLTKKALLEQMYTE